MPMHRLVTDRGPAVVSRAGAFRPNSPFDNCGLIDTQSPLSRRVLQSAALSGRSLTGSRHSPLTPVCKTEVRFGEVSLREFLKNCVGCRAARAGAEWRDTPDARTCKPRGFFVFRHTLTPHQYIPG